MDLELVEGCIPFHNSEVTALYKLWSSSGRIDKRDKLTLTRSDEGTSCHVTYTARSAKKYQDASWAGLHTNEKPKEGPQETPYKIEIRGTDIFCNRTHILDIKNLFKRVSYEMHTGKLKYPLVSLSPNVVGELFVSQLTTKKKNTNRSVVYGFYKLTRHITDLFRGKVINYIEKNLKDYRTILEYILQSQINTWENHKNASYILTDTAFGGTVTQDKPINIKYCGLIAQNPRNTAYYKERLFLNSLLRGHGYNLPSNIFPYNILRHCNFTSLDIDKETLTKARGNIIVVSWANVGWCRWMSELLMTLPKVESVTPLCLFM